MRDDLRKEFNDKIWHGQQDESRSGAGSTLAFTERLRAQLPAFLEKHGVGTFLDAPCGDWNWMASVDLGDIHYIGGDIADAVVEEVRAAHGGPNRDFILLDITSDPLPKADMMMARDVLFHLKFWLRWKFLENFVASGTPLLLTTMHHIKANKKLGKNGGFTKFNPMAAPFNFPAPIDMIHETADDLPADIAERDEGRKHRSMGLWTREQIIAVLDARAAAKAAEEVGA